MAIRASVWATDYSCDYCLFLLTFRHVLKHSCCFRYLRFALETDGIRRLVTVRYECMDKSTDDVTNEDGHMTRDLVPGSPHDTAATAAITQTTVASDSPSAGVALL
mgnify:CR=1 FL=1